MFDVSSETAERNSTKPTSNQDPNVLHQVCVFRANGKTRLTPWPLICWDIFDVSSLTAERNSTKLGRRQDLNVLYPFCFRADRKNKMAALAYDFLKYFWLLWNRWMEFNKTWHEARSQRLLLLVFFWTIEKQDGRPGLWLTETFSTSPLNGIQRNLIGIKMSTSAYKYYFFGPILVWNHWTEFNETGQP